MSRIYRLVYGDRHSEDADRQTASLAALAVVLVILVAAMWLTQKLQATARVEDCLLSNQLNCDRLVPRGN